MINFRYHLVSLIAVFLALAVGIVLGIGPLKGPVSDELSAQVDQLRVRNDQLRDEATQAGATAKERDDYLTATAGQLVGDLLPGQRYVTLSVGDVSGSVRDAVRQRIEQAGATRAGELTVSDTWWAGDSDAVATTASTLRDRTQLPDADGDEAYLLAALTTAVGSAPPASSGDGEQTKTILDALNSGKLVSGSLKERPTAVVVLYEQLATTAQSATPDPADVAEGAFGTRLAGGLASGALPVVAVGDAAWSGEAVSLIRADDELKRKLSSIDNADELTGQLSVPRALSAEFNGVIGHYGVASNATGPLVGETDANSTLVPPHLKAAAPSWNDRPSGQQGEPDGGPTQSPSAGASAGASPGASARSSQGARGGDR